MSADGAPMDAAPEQSDDGGGDISPAVQARLDELSSNVSELLQARQQPQYEGGLSQNVATPPQPQQPQQYAPEPQYQEPEQYYDPQAEQQQAMAELQQYIQAQVQQGVSQQVTPWVRQQQAEQLEQRYPDLQKPEVAGPLVDYAQQFAQQLGSPELAMDPRFIERLYLAQQAEQGAAQQTAANGDNGTRLEQPGAAPQAVEEEPGDAMLSAHGIDPRTAFQR